jgi:oligopeptide/dipeptide ABC transporter ATP-binding protein
MLEIKDLTVRYENTVRPALTGVDLTVGGGEIVCVVGESGSGKSTLALASLGLLDEIARISGDIRVGSRPILELSPRELRDVRGRDVGFVYQDALTAFSPLWTVGEQIAETIRVHDGSARSVAWNRTLRQLAEVRVPEPERIARSYPHELSGGQRQRAALAMALVLEPKLLIADEPTSALDVTTGVHLLALLKQLQAKRSISVLLITHDMGVVDAVADRVAVLYAGLLGEIGERTDVLRSPRFPYTKALVDSVDLDRPRGKLGGIPGTPPGLSEEIDGCPFAPRCPRAQGICTIELPAEREIAGVTVRCHFPLVPEREASVA